MSDGDPSGLNVVFYLLQIGSPFILLVFTYFIGHAIEKSHYSSIRKREQAFLKMPALTFRNLPRNWQAERSSMVTGSVVISIDYFKRFLAGLRGIVGGRIRAYETLLDRARREALLRMKEQAAQKGYETIINVRLETSRLATSRGDGQGTAGVEVLAFGTAVKLVR